MIEEAKNKLVSKIISVKESLTKNLPSECCKNCGNHYPHGPAGCIGHLYVMELDDLIEELINAVKNGRQI